jgi:hypothetical protein
MSYSLLFIIFIRINLLIVAKLHNFLFYTFLCMNFLKYEKSPSIWWNLEFSNYVPIEMIFKILCFWPEDNVKRKTVQHKICWNFLRRRAHLQYQEAPRKKGTRGPHPQGPPLFLVTASATGCWALWPLSRGCRGRRLSHFGRHIFIIIYSTSSLSSM